MANAFTIQGSATLNTRPAERRLQRFIKKAEGAQLNLKINERAFTQPLGRITGEVSEFNKSLKASNARVLAFGASAGAIFAVTSAFRELAKATINVEKRLADINVILGRSNSNLSKFGSELFNIASKTGRAFNEVADAATEFSRQGLGVEKTLQRTRDAMILMRLSGLDAKNAVESLTAAMNSFNNVTLTSTQIVNKMAKVDAAFAVSSRDLAEAIKRVGATAEDAGLSMDQLLAAVTSVQQTTARGGPVIGNSLKTIFTRIKRTEVIDQLKGLGVQVKNLNGTMRPAMAVLKDFAGRFQTLSEAQKAQTAELVGGVFQMNILKSLLKDLARGQSVYSAALKDSVTASNEAITRNEELNQTLAALSNESLQNLTKLAAGIGKLSFEPVARKVLTSFNKIVSGQALGDLGDILGFDQKEAAKTGEEIGKGLLRGLEGF